MSELQKSLLVIGAVVVAAVYGYNRLQERSFRRRMQQAFGAAHDDVLLKAGVESALADGRLEPQLLSPSEPSNEEDDAQAEPAASRGDDTEARFDSVLDCLAEINADTPLPEAAIAELLSRVAGCGKPVQAAGYDPQHSRWEDVARGQTGRYSRLRLSLQLVNRAGSLNAAQLAAFCDAVRQCAARASARATCPDAESVLKSAQELDAFCGQVDNAVGVNVVAAEGASFSGARIRSLAETAGFQLEPDGVFHFRNERRQTLFTLDNHEPAPFLPESIKLLTTRGVTLLLDVPRVANAVDALDRMVEIARGLASAMGGQMVDDNRAVLSDAGIARIKEQVVAIQSAMSARGIPAGGARALRLFS